MASMSAGPYKPAEGVVARDMGHAAVLIHVESNRIFELNKTGARVWSLLEEGASFSDICTRLQQEFPDASDVDATVRQLLAEFSAEGLIVG